MKRNANKYYCELSSGVIQEKEKKDKAKMQNEKIHQDLKLGARTRAKDRVSERERKQR